MNIVLETVSPNATTALPKAIKPACLSLPNHEMGTLWLHVLQNELQQGKQLFGTCDIQWKVKMLQ